MSYADSVLPEFEQEMANTRKVLERVPDDKLDWRPHDKANTIGWNANHLTEMVGWVEGTLAQPEWDLNPEGGERYQSPSLGSTAEILESFDKNVVAAREAIKNVSDEAMAAPWSLLDQGKPLFTMPRSAVIRTFVLNHIVHHRAILCTYLRMVGVAVPGMYGPSGDEG